MTNTFLRRKNKKKLSRQIDEIKKIEHSLFLKKEIKTIIDLLIKRRYFIISIHAGIVDKATGHFLPDHFGHFSRKEHSHFDNDCKIRIARAYWRHIAKLFSSTKEIECIEVWAIRNRDL